MTETLAPCVAVVGPANSGKTALLHLLDEALQRHPSRPLVYVVKGNPDGTGRYLFHAPELREGLKRRIKGAWCETTVVTVCGWIEACRRHLGLVPVDLGGRHAPGNDAILRRCTHFVVVARRFSDPRRERREGMDSWVAACRRSGLAPLARLRSVVQGEARDLMTLGGLASRVDKGVETGKRGGDGKNAGPGREGADLGIRHSSPSRTGRRSQGCGGDFRSEGARRLGAHPWNPVAPARSRPGKGPRGALVVLGRDRGGLVELTITTPDRFLASPRPEALCGLPPPPGEPPPGPLVAFGAALIWLHLAYSCWLRSLPGQRAVGAWDARARSAVLLSGSGAPGFVPRPVTNRRNL